MYSAPSNSQPAIHQTVCLAGSRRGSIDHEKCAHITRYFSKLGFHFLVGCAPGIDQCFRQAVSELVPAKHWTVHCAFPNRAHALKADGLPTVCKVSAASSAAAALHRRTVTMVSECTLLMLFPDDPTTGTWGKGSQLAFNTAVQQHKPVFVVSSIPPVETAQVRVVAASLFGVVSGYWVVPLGVPVREGVAHA